MRCPQCRTWIIVLNAFGVRYVGFANIRPLLEVGILQDLSSMPCVERQSYGRIPVQHCAFHMQKDGQMRNCGKRQPSM